MQARVTRYKLQDENFVFSLRFLVKIQKQFNQGIGSTFDSGHRLQSPFNFVNNYLFKKLMYRLANTKEYVRIY